MEAGAALMADFVADAHSRLIGEHPEPVRIDAQHQVQIVRDERVGEMPPITVPVQEAGALSVVDRVAGWIALGGAIGGLLLFVVGVIMRPGARRVHPSAGDRFRRARDPDRALRLHRAGGRVLPALSDSVWMGIFPRLANDSLMATLGIALGSLILAAAITLGTTSVRQRRQWSTPLSVGRYRDDRTWSSR